MNKSKRRVEKYLAQHATEVEVRPVSARHIVVIPAKAEEAYMAQTLASLDALDGPVAVVVVVNGSDADADSVHTQNNRLLATLNSHHYEFDLHILDRASPGFRTLDGVGDARRLGMDYALRANPDADWLLSLDADSPVTPDYLKQLDEVPTASVGALAGFAHPIPEADHGIVTYELWLRYRAMGIAQASPFGFVALGSIIAVRPHAYAAVRGMPRRTATEDFHFINKLVKFGDVHRFQQPTVFPSPRLSTRVPLGTGRAVAMVDAGEPRYSHVVAPEVFGELRAWFEGLGALFESDEALTLLASPMKGFVLEAGWAKTSAELRRHSKSQQDFEQRAQTWFDGIKSIRYLNQRTHNTPILEACEQLLGSELATPQAALESMRATSSCRVMSVHPVGLERR